MPKAKKSKKPLLPKRPPTEDKRVFQVVIDYGGQSPTQEALIVALNEEAVNETVAGKIAHDWGDTTPAGHTIEIEEMTPDFIEATYLASVETDSPFYGQVDWRDIPQVVVDVLLPKCDLDYAPALANIKLMRSGKRPIGVEPKKKILLPGVDFTL
jgi:hypothetical protein